MFDTKIIVRYFDLDISWYNDFAIYLQKVEQMDV